VTLGQRIGQGIREQRQRAQLSQLKLAEAAGLSIDQVGQVERGRRNLSIRALERVAQALGTDPAELFTRGDRRGP
jgi:transcriptional regulator with XRE-family HTH domain